MTTSIKTICDVCQTEAIEPDSFPRVSIAGEAPGLFRGFDLCTRCLARVRGFLDSKPTAPDLSLNYAPQKFKDLDTTNHFGVGSTAGLVGVLLVGGRFSFTAAEAENLAAWLLVMSGVDREHFNALVEAIENT